MSRQVAEALVDAKDRPSLTDGEARRHRLLVAALWILAGLALQAVSFTWNSPRGFLLFVLGGGLLTATGMLLYLREALFGSADSSRARS